MSTMIRADEMSAALRGAERPFWGFLGEPSTSLKAAAPSEQCPIIYVVDGDTGTQGLISRLVHSIQLECRCFADGKAFLTDYDAERSGCLIVETSVCGPGGVGILRLLRKRVDPRPVIVITAYPEVSTAVDALKAGAIDYLEKPFNAQMLLDRIYAGLALDARRRARARELARVRSCFTTLSGRERQVFELLCEGGANREMAVRLGLSPRTVEVHRRHVMDKMRAESLAQLIRKALLLQARESGGGKWRED
jgi:two-component system, LuxR family, response regulator FixJ